jgi:hypothetical protein
MHTVHRAGLCLSSAAFLGLVSLAATAAPATPVKIACIGEQTTHSDQLQRSVEYPAKLQVELGSNFDVQNFGDCCSTVLLGYPKQPETHPYLDGGVAPSFFQSVAYLPDIVVVGSWGKHDTEIANSLYAGTLDPVKFQTDYEQLVTTYLNLSSKPTVYVSTPVPIPKGAPLGPTTSVILPTVQAIASKYHLPIVPLYPAFLNRPDLYKDDTHVSDDAGLQTIADTVYTALGFGPPPDGGGLDGAPPAPGDAAAAEDAAAEGSSPGYVRDAGNAGSTSSSSSSGSGGMPLLGAAPSNNSAGCAVARPGGLTETSGWVIAAGLVALLGRRRSRRTA